MTFSEAAKAFRNGSITNDAFNEYAYAWRDSVFRFSKLGYTRAKRHAQKHGLRMAFSDLNQEDRDALRIQRGSA